MFFAIPKELSLGDSFQGVLLFVVLVSCVIMAWALISHKNNKKTEKETLDSDKELVSGVGFDNSNIDTEDTSGS